MNDTERRFPRTMQEAFPKDYFEWMEGPSKLQADADTILIPWITFFIGLVVGLALCR
jgi:hypothetical protein